MELKNAVTICLISLFSATLVLLIARALDLQAAARLEPQLARIVEELEALRQQGGIAAAASAGRTDRPTRDRVLPAQQRARCATCRAVESQTLAGLAVGFRRRIEGRHRRLEAVELRGAPRRRSGEEVRRHVVCRRPREDAGRRRSAEWKRLDRAGRSSETSPVSPRTCGTNCSRCSARRNPSRPWRPPATSPQRRIPSRHRRTNQCLRLPTCRFHSNETPT